MGVFSATEIQFGGRQKSRITTLGYGATGLPADTLGRVEELDWTFGHNSLVES